MFRGKKEPKKDLILRIFLRAKSIPERQYNAVMNVWANTLKQFETQLGQLYNQGKIDIELMKRISEAFELEKFGATKIKNAELSAIFSSGAGDLFDTSPPPSSTPPTPPLPQTPASTDFGSSPQPSEPDPYDFEALLTKESSPSPPSSPSADVDFDEFFGQSPPSPSSPPSSSSTNDNINEIFASPKPQSSSTPTSTRPPSPPVSSEPMPSIKLESTASPPQSSAPTIPLPTTPNSSSSSSTQSRTQLPTLTTPSSSIPAPQPATADEEDRATGIAVLRKQMLTELKKIRSIIDENE